MPASLCAERASWIGNTTLDGDTHVAFNRLVVGGRDLCGSNDDPLGPHLVVDVPDANNAPIAPGVYTAAEGMKAYLRRPEATACVVIDELAEAEVIVTGEGYRRRTTIRGRWRSSGEELVLEDIDERQAECETAVLKQVEAGCAG